MTTDQFTETTTSTAAAAGCLPETVRLYADLGLIECVRLSKGIRLFKRSAVPKVQAIYAERMANRGRAKRPAPAARVG